MESSSQNGSLDSEFEPSEGITGSSDTESFGWVFRASIIVLNFECLLARRTLGESNSKT